MPLIKNGGEIADVWTFVTDNDALDSHGAATVSLTRLSRSRDPIAAQGVCRAPYAGG